ncbi:MAG: hypothetical protein JWR68_1263 [Polaromonas sp.]|nr:hypothetical protein [Polaromonas sp.]
MKIRKLFFRAFGPFTNSVLDFSGPAGLHVIYGANEAGKSSALRAIADLRYGIPVRSKDDFVHDFKDMLLAGCFEDVAGRAIGLARRKGNKDPLMNADPATGDALPASPVAPEVLLALTGGVAREQFETMYGLNSLHLRKGGQMLIQGEGELGAALFEASTGSAGIKAMLQTLQADAKKYFMPKGQLPILNEAARQLDEARQRYKLAVTKPDQWKALKRGHEEAHSRLAAIRSQLAAQRRQLAELTELRAVEPLLRQLDLAGAQWAEAQGHAALPPDTRERRLAALEHQNRSQGAMAQADEAINTCKEALLALKIEPLLLAHAAAIDRLEADCSLVRRERDSRLKLQVATEDEAAQLRLQMARMVRAGASVMGLDEFFKSAPSAADQARLAHELETLQSLTFDLQHVQSRLTAAERKHAQLTLEVTDEPAPQLQQALALALEQAQVLGNAHHRLDETALALQAEQRKLEGALRDLGLASAEQLQGVRWLASAEIDAYERERGALLRLAALNESKKEALQVDLATQQRRGKQLAATGEVVTAETLQQARTLRDQDWQAIRAAFIHPSQPTYQPNDAGPVSPSLVEGLPRQFEMAQAQADRQADLLREGARRAAEVAECAQRIAEMTQALAALEASAAAQADALATLDASWHQTLSRLALPPGTAAGVREWLVLRQTALERQERVEQARQAGAVLGQQVATARIGLTNTLTALGHAVPEQPPPPLDTLIAWATAADRRMVTQQAASERRAADIASLAREIRADQAEAAELSRGLEISQATVQESVSRLYLETGAASVVIKARLAELQHWVNDYQRHVAHLQQLGEMKAGETAAASAASALGRLLGEAVGDHLDAWLDGVAQRLSTSREAAAAKAALERRQAEETLRWQRAASDLQAAGKEIEALVLLAGVSHADALPEAEARSDRRRAAALRLQELQEQLARTSAKDASALRQEVAGLDSVAIDLEKQACLDRIERLQAEEHAAIEGEQLARAALAQVDTSDDAARAREEMEEAIARYRAGVRPWAQLKLAEALLGEALKRHREKAQGPVVALAGDYFRLMTGGRFARLLVDADSDTPLLRAQPAQGRPVEVGALSEGTADQLYLSLRLAALQLQRTPERMMPLVLDDVFMTADDDRAAHMFRALEKFAAASQVLVFTHHHHLLEIASGAVSTGGVGMHRLESAFAGRSL